MTFWFLTRHERFREPLISIGEDKGLLRFLPIFLQKNPFEAPFFTYDALRMIRVAPKRVSYANGLAGSFKADV